MKIIKSKSYIKLAQSVKKMEIDDVPLPDGRRVFISYNLSYTPPMQNRRDREVNDPSISGVGNLMITDENNLPIDYKSLPVNIKVVIDQIIEKHNSDFINDFMETEDPVDYFYNG